MSFIKSITCILAVTAISTTTSTAFAWGAVGHELIAYVGGDTATNGQEFWQSNLDPLHQLTTVPDRIWKEPATKPNEAPNHWFQVDHYYTSDKYFQIPLFPSSYEQAVSQYTEPIVTKNGTAPWRIRELYQMAINAFKIKNYSLALQYVGTMSHYIGDLSQPLHVTENYDGQETNNVGIHMFFENENIGNEMPLRDEIKLRTQKLLKDPQFLSQFKGTLMDTLLNEVERSISFKDVILANDTKYGRTGQGAAVQLELAKDRIADGAATFALILNRLWLDAAIELKASPMTIQDPQWIQNDYSDLTLENKSLIYGDDCAQN
ncbi:MAG: hypothetical protein H7235_10055 [Bdellovibrionaceae bacterium]|nr:hypothetical protein [Pseudobdellovibrionaceae bacterium]